MKLRDRLGWPVTTIEGFHPIINLLRRLIHTNIKQTWKRRNQKDTVTYSEGVYTDAPQGGSNEAS